MFCAFMCFRFCCLGVQKLFFSTSARRWFGLCLPGIRATRHTSPVPSSSKQDRNIWKCLRSSHSPDVAMSDIVRYYLTWSIDRPKMKQLKAECWTSSKRLLPEDHRGELPDELHSWLRPCRWTKRLSFLGVVLEDGLYHILAEYGRILMQMDGF